MDVRGANISTLTAFFDLPLLHSSQAVARAAASARFMARMLLLYLIPLSLLLFTYANLASRELATRLATGGNSAAATHNRLLVEDSSQSSTTSKGSGASSTENDPLGDSELVDIVLVASVDGKFHALNRTSGHVLWSMASDDGYSTAKSNFSAFAPLVRTQHPQPQPLEGDKMPDVRSMAQEFYIVEPQSGDIYIATTTSPFSPLQRFPHSMSELVDMVPFAFDDGHYRRHFTGSKESKLISFAEADDEKDKSIDLDELEEGAAEVEYVDYNDEEDSGKHGKGRKSTEVLIGRTDYHISIVTRPTATSPVKFVPPVQTLSFSVYGPNNQDGFLQNMYARTKDDNYVASLPTGEVIAFKSKLSKSGQPIDPTHAGLKPSLLWMQQFRNPIVATFDVLHRQSPSGVVGFSDHQADHTYVLLQPQPALRDFSPSLDPETNASTGTPDSENGRSTVLPNTGSAYIGIVEESGSLFAMSPDKYPFIAFEQRLNPTGDRKLLDAPQDDDDDEGLLSLDEVTKRRKEKERTTSKDSSTTSFSSTSARSSSSSRPQPKCDITEGSFDVWCLVGVRKLADMSDEKAMGAPVAVGRRGSKSGRTDNDQVEKYYGGRSDYPRLDAPPDDDDEDYSSSYPTSPPSTDSHRSSNTNTNANTDPPVRVPATTPQSTGLLSMLFLSGSGAAASTLALAFFLSSFIFLRSRPEVRDGLRQMLPNLPSKAEVRTTRLPTIEEAHEGHVLDPNVLGNGLTNGDDDPLPPHPQTPIQLDSLSPSPLHLPSETDSPLLRPVLEEALSDLDNIPTRERTLSTSKPLPPTPSQKLPVTPKSASTKLPATPKTTKTTKPPTSPTRTRKQSTTHSRGTSNGVEDSDADVTSAAEFDGEGDEVDEDDEQEGEVGGAETPRKTKGTRRGKRGKKKRKGAAVELNGNGKENIGNPATLIPAIASPSMVVLSTPVVPQPSLIISETILGFGSHGTVVFRGDLQGRQVAVKRLLKSFVTLASREVSILQESDDHPNVIRYYYQEAHADFLYIALELCPASLADIIEYAASGSRKEGMNAEDWSDLIRCFDPKKALKQIASGLRHLHALKLVHRDIKPQNILVSAGPGRGGAVRARGSMGGYRMLISDFGLTKKLDVDQTSFLPTAQGALGAGTVGWRAPEILRGEVRLDDADDQSSRGSSIGTATIGSTGTNGSTNSSGIKPTRLTKSVDIFALGCLFYYTLTNGLHPFGDRFEREVNILKGAVNLDGLDRVDGGGRGRWSEEAVEARDLIQRMLSDEARDRPDTTTCLLHPFFWDSGKRLNFLQDASDRFEVMCRDPKDDYLLSLEEDAHHVVGNDWYSRMDRVFVENLGKFRKYDGKSVQDLLRALRNKKHHYQDLPENVKRHLGPMPEGYLAYFTRRYPNLFIHVHRVIGDSELKDESLFNTYFELNDL